MTTTTFDPARARLLLTLGSDWLADQLGFDSRTDRDAFTRAYVRSWLPRVERLYDDAAPEHRLTILGHTIAAAVLDASRIQARFPERTVTVRIRHEPGAIEVRRGEPGAPWTEYVRLAAVSAHAD